MRTILDYPITAFSKTEEDFSIAYSIRMHKDPEQVEMLLRAIYAPQNVYCIYIDKKSSPEVHEAMHNLSQCFPNVFIASHLEPFYYATRSQMEADLQCMRDLLHTSVPWKYYLNLAGQEFPLRSNREIVEMLTLMNGTNDIEVGKYVRGLRWRYLSRVIPDIEKGFRFDGQKLDKLGLNVTLYKGSAYGAFSRKFVQFVLSDSRVQRLRHWLADTFAPEETFFATVNAMSGAPGGYPVYVNQKAGEHISRVVLWKDTMYPPCQGVYVRGVCILTSPDLKWLVQRPQMFANKFDVNVDRSAVQCLLHNILLRRN
ncbi:beta-1,3-galactosyl-O-glycosyl-glycoprotein beta-1,6-N-acetylglucosaminyltransferase 3-like [Liolophura sinensis]|uniref:beta-1,3-galactosyl-O-glycosyl-glycoprotein beta-1,6-N-acetylglucosaminyltransferase 3-like n=1 Tax=Liolophura sinensis TaxID=3198878 RepID=UPI0031581008